MDGILAPLGRIAKRNLEKEIQATKDAALRTRYLVIHNLNNGYRPTHVAEMLMIGRTTVYRVAQRYNEHGLDGLRDLRENNGQRKVTPEYLDDLTEVVKKSPQDYQWPRPTWTRELLIGTLEQLKHPAIHPTTMSLALQSIDARLGRPKPIVLCPLPKAVKTRRLNDISRLLGNLPDNEILVYEDEVDIHLNPKIGMDWMLRGQQKEVLTPGQNQKRYMAGSLNALTGELVYVEYERKNSALFVLMLGELMKRYPEAERIHVVLDNYSIHHTQLVHECLATELGQRFSLHFLPPYCPDHNRIERVWQDLHANVTRNHRATDMDELMKLVRQYLQVRNANIHKNFALAA